MTAHRQTKQLKAVRAAFTCAGRPLSIDEVHASAIRDVPSLGLRTVYRAVRRLQELDEVVSVPVPGGSDRYELACIAAHHHHHFHCTECDRYFDVNGCPGGLKKLVPEGFQLEHHELTLSGRCNACAQ
ncbi:MAG: transcriptional repressor [Phycisphaerales bacterium]|jgi:Fur family ferric uptake transcriptional regulator|nr:transcriptional repressor [Phycisphaerales bacterium]